MSGRMSGLQLTDFYRTINLMSVVILVWVARVYLSFFLLTYTFISVTWYRLSVCLNLAAYQAGPYLLHGFLNMYRLWVFRLSPECLSLAGFIQLGQPVFDKILVSQHCWCRNCAGDLSVLPKDTTRWPRLSHSIRSTAKQLLDNSDTEFPINYFPFHLFVQQDNPLHWRHPPVFNKQWPVLLIRQRPSMSPWQYRPVTTHQFNNKHPL